MKRILYLSVCVFVLSNSNAVHAFQCEESPEVQALGEDYQEFDAGHIVLGGVEYNKLIAGQIDSVVDDLNFTKSLIERGRSNEAVVHLTEIYNQIRFLTVGESLHPCLKPYLLNQIASLSGQKFPQRQGSDLVFFTAVNRGGLTNKVNLVLRYDELEWIVEPETPKAIKKLSDKLTTSGSKSPKPPVPKPQLRHRLLGRGVCYKTEQFFHLYADRRIIVVPEVELIAFVETVKSAPHLLSFGDLILASTGAKTSDLGQQVYCGPDFEQLPLLFSDAFEEGRFYIFEKNKVSNSRPDTMSELIFILESSQ